MWQVTEWVVVQSQLTLPVEVEGMIAVRCPKCGSPDRVKNGHTSTGQQKYHCKACRRYGTLDTQEAKREQQRQMIERLHTERVSQRGIARITGLSRTTIIKWLTKSS